MVAEEEDAENDDRRFGIYLFWWVLKSVFYELWNMYDVVRRKH